MFLALMFLLFAAIGVFGCVMALVAVASDRPADRRFTVPSIVLGGCGLAVAALLIVVA